MPLGRLLWLSLLTVAAMAIDPGEVRIRSTAWLPPSTRISVESRLVEVGVTVRDRKGQPVDGLQSSDFEVLDDGKPQTITLFSARRSEAPAAAAPSHAPASHAPAPAGESASAPRSIALFFDDTRSEPFGLNRARVAAEKLLAAGLPPADHAAIFTASGLVSQDFTADLPSLRAALAALRIHPVATTKGIGVCPTLTAYQAFGIHRHVDSLATEVAVNEAIACNCGPGDSDCPRRQVQVVESAAQVAWNQIEIESAQSVDTLGTVLRRLATAPGARILLLMSPGFLTTGMEQRTDALTDIALRAGVLVNALDSEGLAAVSPEVLGTRDGRRFDWAQRTMNTRQQVVTEWMASLAPATGGRFLQNTNDFNTAVERLTTLPEASYVLGIAPPAEPDDRYHSLKVGVPTSSGYRIESRAGYFASTPPKKPATAQELIDRMVTSKETPRDLPASIRVSSKIVGGHLTIQVDTTVDASGLTFADKDDRHLQQITFVTIVEDASGNYVSGKEAVMDLELKDPTLADLRAKGIHTSTSFGLADGGYVVRVVIREASAGRMSAFREAVAPR